MSTTTGAAVVEGTVANVAGTRVVTGAVVFTGNVVELVVVLTVVGDAKGAPLEQALTDKGKAATAKTKAILASFALAPGRSGRGRHSGAICVPFRFLDGPSVTVALRSKVAGTTHSLWSHSMSLIWTHPTGPRQRTAVTEEFGRRVGHGDSK